MSSDSWVKIPAYVFKQCMHTIPMGLHVNWIVLYVYNNNFDCSKGFVYIGHKTSKAKYRLVLRLQH